MARKKNSSLGCLFWIALILLILVVFLFSRERIAAVLESTGFGDLVQTFQQDGEEPEIKRIPPEEPETRPAKEEQGQEKEQEQEIPLRPEIEPEVEEGEHEAEPSQKEEEAPLVEKRLRTSILYFVMVGDDGNITLQHVARPVYFKASPLTRTIEALFHGLSPAELNKGLISLIPDSTSLRSVAVKNGVAYIDLNEAFSFNEFGAEGANASLKQLVYTATEFPTVSAVQILINGKKQDYLMTEGLSIIAPIKRSSFP